MEGYEKDYYNVIDKIGMKAIKYYRKKEAKIIRINTAKKFLNLLGLFLRDMVLEYKATRDKSKLKGMDKALNRLILECLMSWI